jgi:hypothetical protein
LGECRNGQNQAERGGDHEGGFVFHHLY